MNRTYHPDLRDTLSAYEQRINFYTALAGRAVRWRNRATAFQLWPRWRKRLAGGAIAALILTTIADLYESDYLEAVMDFDNSLSGELM